MLTGIQRPSFKGYPYHKVQCANAAQAKKLMSEMQAKLNIDCYSGSKGSEIMVQSMQNTKDVKAMLDCMNKVSEQRSPVNDILNVYRKFNKKQPDSPTVNVRL